MHRREESAKVESERSRLRERGSAGGREQGERERGGEYGRCGVNGRREKGDFRTAAMMGWEDGEIWCG